MPKKDITGQRFGDMIVLKDSGFRQNRKVVWFCECDCGESFYVRSDHINTGKTTSCPKCASKRNIENLLSKNNTTRKNINIGDRFGKLTILEQLNEKDSARTYYWLCQCDCGNITKVAGSHWGKTYSCGSCLKSKGEYKISQILIENNIQFEQEKTFNTCRFPDSQILARYDFYLPDFNLLIEYDGIQHYFCQKNKSLNNKENFKQLQQRDLFKTQLAKENNIKLKRIPYYDYNKITLEYILNQEE